MSYNIPVTRDFVKDWENHIGELTIFDDDFKIPFNSVFALAGKVNEETGEIEILEVSLIPDNNYIGYLKHGKKSDEKLMKVLKERAKKK